MDDLVRATGVGRGAIYSEFGGKRDLFLASLAHYQSNAVTAGFAIVEAESARLADIEAFLKNGVSTYRDIGLPAPGCLMGNTLTELSAHDAEIGDAVRAHYDRLTDGFARALANEVNHNPSNTEIIELAGLLTISVQGLWSYARGIDNVFDLESKVETLLKLVKLQLAAFCREHRGRSPRP